MATESSASSAGPLDFNAVREAETRAGCRPPGESLGLAFSGGGIRSATFNLGVIQALAELKLLRRFDYLSTISGGGYIGGWLSAFIRRYAGGKVEQAEEALGKRDGALEHAAIRFLRAYSNYLTPRMGLTADAFTAAATYLRNLLLNLTVLVTLLGALLIVPRVAALGATHLVAWQEFDVWYEVITAAPLLLATLVVALNLLYRPEATRRAPPWYTRSAALALCVDVPVLAGAAVTICYYIAAARVHAVTPGDWLASGISIYLVLWIFGVLVASLAAQGASATLARMRPSRERAPWVLAFLAFAVLAGAAGAAAFYAIAVAIEAAPEEHRLWAGAVFGPPAMILAIAAMLAAHVGLMSRKFSEGDRELWSVFGARLLRLALLWSVFFGIAFYGPAVIEFTDDWLRGLGGLAWIASTLFGVIAGRSAVTGKQDAKPWVEFLTRIAPHVFVLGLLLALSWGMHRALEASYDAWRGADESAQEEPPAPPVEPGVYFMADPHPGAALVTVGAIPREGLWTQFLAETERRYPALESWFDPFYALPLILAATLTAMLLVSWRVNINLFSLHHFYRNRLARCYLGATNEARRPHPLTGFDAEDDLELAALAGQKPLHILGTAINLNRGRQLAWQNRRAASFAFTPLHAGYEPASRVVPGAYRPTAQYGRDAAGEAIPLGTAIAISGAAANPNQGFHTSPSVAFLMTVFNVRLGHWCGDPRRAEAWRWRDPRLSLRYWLAELTGSADQDTPFVALSDGGHFENLGVYELVRRRCAVIVASDAGADPKYAFDDLAEAMRKCYTDFGVRIEFRAETPVEDIRPADAERPGVRHYAIADVRYPGAAQTGVLVYWKASLGAGLPPDILHYRRVHPEFPHQTTADQFFDEAQFETYRHLGYEVAKRSITAMRARNELPDGLA